MRRRGASAYLDEPTSDQVYDAWEHDNRRAPAPGARGQANETEEQG